MRTELEKFAVILKNEIKQKVKKFTVHFKLKHNIYWRAFQLVEEYICMRYEIWEDHYLLLLFLFTLFNQCFATSVFHSRFENFSISFPNCGK